MSAARSRGQGWPKATRRAAALTPARTEPHFGVREHRPSMPAAANCIQGEGSGRANRERL
jgi:hypothetical protein